MSKNYEITIDGHPNIYNNFSSRKLNIYFSEPDEGINEETGLLLLIPGFGANANSNVYKKMRSDFADKYNVVTIQCDYFGWEFMQNTPLKESAENFNDMGVLQALDNISAVLIVSEIIKDNNFRFNTSKIIAYGHSHGAYLAYLCNVFAPNLFSLIVDNSAWIFPVYLLSDVRRALYFNGNEYTFDYFAKTIVKDYEILHLPTVYKNFNNNCIIHSFHGINDNLVSMEEKKSFCLPLKQCYLHEITLDKIDYKIFKSTSHGLEADFFLLFDELITKYDIKFKSNNSIIIQNHCIETKNYSYFFDYSGFVPILQRELKHLV
jgi:pimeloyl-ACP methyl ester carboxylesterase